MSHLQNSLLVKRQTDNTIVEDEFHFTLECDLYNDERQLFIKTYLSIIDVDLVCLRGCQLSKSNTCIIFTCIKKTNNLTKETGYS